MENLLIKEILKELEGFEKAKIVFKYLINNWEIRNMLDKVNDFLMKKLSYNDHGIVHSLIVTKNSIKIAKILKKKGFKFDLEDEGFNFEDVLVILILSSFLHDLGNAIHRKYHQIFSIILAKEYVEEILKDLYPKRYKRLVLDVLHNIVSHQGEIFEEITLEAKVLAIADGLDMEEGRARYSYKLSIPDIHTYSALSIKKVIIKEGEIAPIRVEIFMENPAGIFQVEEVFKKKIDMGNSWDLLEIYIYIEPIGDLIKIIKGKWYKEKISK